MPKSELNFERRLKKILESKGYLVIKVRKPVFTSQPYDLIAIRDGKAIPIEVKGKNTPYPEEQFKKQTNVANNCKTDFVIIFQSKKKQGKMIICQWNVRRKRLVRVPSLDSFVSDLKEHLV